MRSPTYNNVTTTIILLIFPTISKLVCSFQSSYVKLHNVIIPHSKNCVWSASNDLNCRHKEWSDGDKALQQEAATALLPVFFPEHTDGLASMKPMNAEMALKRLLRKKYSQRQSDNPSNFTDQSRKSSIDKSRGRLAELILGTSVMRLRHFVVVAAVAAQDSCTVPLPYPLNYSEISPLFGEKRIIDDFISCSVESKMSICKLMVEEHAKYISSTESSQLEPIQALVGNDDDPTLLIAIEHSIPSFLASSLVSQYGYDTTKQICSLMNDPGPITIRKNAILFKGTDEELCTWLWEKDGVKASPMKNLLKSETMNICSYDLDKVKRYKGNVGVMGQSIRPPAGCICIHPPTDGRGRTKLSKSIWNMLGYQKGFFEVQDAGSQCIVQALDLVPSSISDGTSVLDYCAGNGGKTFAITSAIFDRKINYSESVECKNAIAVAHIVSHDVVDERLRQIKGSLSRVGFDLDSFTDIAECNQDNLRCTLQTVTPADIKALSASDTLFEVVLVDVPCSSSGVLRRRPSQRWLMSEEDTLQSLPTLQLDIIQKAATFVRGGGTLVYATCSLLKEENEEVIKSFETSEVFRNGGFVPWPFSEDCIDLSEEDAFRDRHHEITLLPSEWNDGFFFARYTKEL
jgi:16S rRNA C967 or C1407 C5-methylase (RsmB/RsmF family)